MKIRIQLALVCGLVAVLATGCMSMGGSHERHWKDDLANGKLVSYDSNGVPSAPVNGGETVEKHFSWDLNPFSWLFGGSASKGDSEIVVAAPSYQAQVTYGYAASVSPEYSYAPTYSYGGSVGYGSAYGYPAPTYGYGYPAVEYEIRIGPDGREHQYPRASGQRGVQSPTINGGRGQGAGNGQRGGGPQYGYAPPSNGGQRGVQSPPSGGGQRGGSPPNNGGGQGGQRGGGGQR